MIDEVQHFKGGKPLVDSLQSPVLEREQRPLSRPHIVLDVAESPHVCVLKGDFVISVIEGVNWQEQLPQLRNIDEISLRHVSRIDTSGAWFVQKLIAEIVAAGGQAVVTDATEPQRHLLAAVKNCMPQNEIDSRQISLSDLLERYGRYAFRAFQKALQITSFVGELVASLVGVMLHPRRMRGISLVHHMQEVGLNAVPIVSLMAFLIGIVLAFQGAAQLRQFGAEVFVVDLISISVLRELGILLTAIIVAGRSGSAFTASIGSMKMREEIDAMRTLGLDPIEILVVPRVLALVFMLPILGFIADIMGLVGGALMSWIELGVSPGVFQARLVENTEIWHFGVGMIKAPFFALIIGIVGCYEGLQVEGNAESLGRLTSTSVVLAIFLVIVADAVFSIFFAIVGV